MTKRRSSRRSIRWIPDFGIPKLERLPQVYASTDQLVFTLEMLDPYASWRSQPLLPPVTGGSVENAIGAFLPGGILVAVGAAMPLERFRRGPDRRGTTTLRPNQVERQPAS